LRFSRNRRLTNCSAETNTTVVDDFVRKAQNCADFGVFLGDVANDNLMATREDQVVKIVTWFWPESASESIRVVSRGLILWKFGTVTVWDMYGKHSTLPPDLTISKG
jgi:hypothetical protein